MTIKKAIALAGTRRDLADLLGISTQATYQWKRKLPPARVEQLRALRPEWFAA